MSGAEEFKTGDRVRLPGGEEATVLWPTPDGLVCVKLDGEARGLYPPDRLKRLAEDGEE